MDNQLRRRGIASGWLGLFVTVVFSGCGSQQSTGDGLPGRRIILSAERPGEAEEMVPLDCDETFTLGGDTWINGDLDLPPGRYQDLRVVVHLPGARVRGGGAWLEWTQEQRDPEGNLTGVLVEDAPGAVVEGIEVSGFDVGVHVMRSDGAVLRGIGAAGNRQGMRVDHLFGARVENCAMEFNYDGNGLDVSGLRNSLIRDCWIADNKHDGFYLLADSRNNHVESTWIVGNGDEGLGIGYSGGNVVRGNTIGANGHGILLYNAEEDTILGNDLRWNRDPLVLETGVSGCVVEGNAIVGNGSGIHVDTAVGCRFLSNWIEDSGEVGLSLGLHAHGNEVFGNVFRGQVPSVLIYEGAINPERYLSVLDEADVDRSPRGNVIHGNHYRECEAWIEARTTKETSDIWGNVGHPCNASLPGVARRAGEPAVRQERLGLPRLLNEPDSPVLEFSLPAVDPTDRLILVEQVAGVEWTADRIRWRRGPAEDPRIVLALANGPALVAFRTLWLGTLNQDF